MHKGDNTTTFSIFSNGKWRCFKCGAWGDMARLLVHVKHMSLKQAQDFIGSAPMPFRPIEEIPALGPYRKGAKKEPYTLLREAAIAPYQEFCPKYLVARGFSRDSLKRYEIGYDVQKSKIVIPVRDWRAKLVGLTYRLDFDDDKSQPAKYWHDNFMKALHLYGFHFWAGRKLRRFYLVEGQLDAVRMYQLGYAASAIMGSEISTEQVQLLSDHCQAEQIVLAFDNDEAGFKARRDAIGKLSKTRFGQSLRVLSYEGKDPGDLDETSRVVAKPWHACLYPQNTVS